MSRNRDQEYIEDDIIRMRSGDKPIRINDRPSATYFRTNSYQQELLNTPNTWHMITVLHGGIYRKIEIIDTIYDAVGDCEFYPVGYKEGNKQDTFVVRNCKPALQKLFHANLSLPMPDRKSLYLTISLNAADYSTGQIFPKKVLEKIVDRKFRRLETTDKISQVLNLEQIGIYPEMSDIIINLGNKPALELLCKVITQKHSILNTINGLNLSKNNIIDPSPLKEFIHSSVKMIDLRHNNIHHINKFLELKSLDVEELYVMGNPFTTQLDYLDDIKKILPNLRHLDGISTEKIKQTSTDTIEKMYPGDIIQDDRDRTSFKMYSSSDMWHQVVIEHKGQCSKRDILKALFSIVDDEFYPCYYKIARIEDTFFTRKSHRQLEHLLDVGLSLPVPNCEPIPITLKMNVSEFRKGHVEPQEAIATALSTRFKVMDKCLNLESLHKSPELKNVIVNLSHTETFGTVVKMAIRRFVTNLEVIKFGRNRITSVKALKILNSAKGIKVVDLGHNLIENLSEFENLFKIPITELTLDGNPLCAHFTSGVQYIKRVKKVFPELTKLDGHSLTKISTALPFEKNFLCTFEGYGFVEEFVTRFFPIFDSPNRNQLIEMYDDNAMVSMSCNYDVQRISSSIAARIRVYEKYNHNLLIPVYLPNVTRGKRNIRNLFDYFPQTEHDLFSFTTDITIATEHLIALTITGVYQEPATVTASEITFSFCRSFIFKLDGSELGIFKQTNEYKIINDIIFVTNPTNEQARAAFQYVPKKPQNKSLSVQDKENFMVMFQRMTGLKTVWCTQCFEEAGWDFKKALAVFLQMESEKRIPDSAFNAN